jgi:hypothetical protein
MDMYSEFGAHHEEIMNQKAEKQKEHDKYISDCAALYEMKLHSRIIISSFTSVLRVSGGWLYETVLEPSTGIVGVTFVPYSTEFKDIADKDMPF